MISTAAEGDFDFGWSKQGPAAYGNSKVNDEYDHVESVERGVEVSKRGKPVKNVNEMRVRQKDTAPEPVADDDLNALLKAGFVKINFNGNFVFLFSVVLREMIVCGISGRGGSSHCPQTPSGRHN